MALRRWRAFVALLCAEVALLAGARAADLPPPPPAPDLLTPLPVAEPTHFFPFPTPANEINSYEVRAGVFLHGIGTDEKGGVDANVEVLLPRLPNSLNLPTQWQFFIPRPQFGAMLNPDGKTSYGYVGVAWTVNLLPSFFLEPMFGGAIHDGNASGVDIPHEATLGCRALFHTGLSAGYRVTDHWTALFTWDHISNGGICDRNVGLNDYGLKLGYSF
jgi:hypothetical protein